MRAALASLAAVIQSVKAGLSDALRVDRAVHTLLADAEARGAFARAVKLNLGLFLGVSIVVQQGLVRLLAALRAWQGVAALPLWLTATSDALLLLLFVVPVYVLALIYNAEYYDIIARRVLVLCSPKLDGTNAVRSASLLSSVEAVLDTVRATLLAILLMLLTSALNLIPTAGALLGAVYSCWLNSFYCFDYKWTLLDSRATLDTRLAMFERNWAYMLGFGLPCTLLLAWLPGTWSLGAYAVLFPIFLCTAMLSAPVPVSSAQRFVPTRVAVFREVRWLLARVLERVPALRAA